MPGVFEVIKSVDLKEVGIKAKKADNSPFTEDEKLALRKKAISYDCTTLKILPKGSTPESIDNEMCPVMVDEMAEIEREKNDHEIIFPLLIKPDNDKGNKWGQNYDWRAKQGDNQTTFNSWRSKRTIKHAARDLYTPPLSGFYFILNRL